jgi:hypothetical protein
MFPFAPDGVAVDGEGEHLRCHVGNKGEDLLPIAADLLASEEAACRMGGCFVAIVLGEAADDAVYVVGVRRIAKPIDQCLCGSAIRCGHVNA